jgi:NAD(P)-dependent dehydrogenase (short-subunit alcohol dehydrogenase family)
LKKPKARTAIIISISSDIGTALAKHWRTKGWSVLGTYRTRSPAVDQLAQLGVGLVACDLASSDSIRKACRSLKKRCPAWDALIMCPATQEPIGLFQEVDFDDWEASVRVNFTSQMRVVHELLPTRRVPGSRKDIGPCVLFYAGPGTNNAPTHYSAYIISKIALVKMCELLDREVPDTRFTIIGPGWIKTKAHEATLKAGKRAGANYDITLRRIANNEFGKMEDVLLCSDWAVRSRRELVGGRNFSVVNDRWGDRSLDAMLKADPDLYKLRRCGNNKLVKK